ncbi:hypothetical protein FKP32DRAFT_1116727 [Trametes sanguinea]|nr:hypothetical protein FKP32DRAFT_1116727 [Trametes sanguinea]
MNHRRLNHDVLSLIMDISNRQTLCCLMQTCKEFCRLAAKHILAGGVTLRSQVQACTFLPFLLADPTHRLPLLRTLKISIFTDVRRCPTADCVMAGLFRLLANGGGLLDLDLAPAEQLLSSHSQLPSAIAGIKTLRCLRLVDVGTLAAGMLAQLQPQLVTADLHYGPKRERRADFDRNPFHLLRHSTQTLRNLSLSSAVIHHLDASALIPCFANVTALTLECMDVPSIQPYVRAFPRLQSLTVDLDEDGSTIAKDFNQLMLQRTSNQQKQKTLGSWPRLASFTSGNPCTLYCLGIACPISSVLLCDVVEGWEPIATALSEALSDAHPIELTLELIKPYTITDLEFLPVFDKPALRDLQVLVLRLHLRHEDQDIDWPRILELLLCRIVAQLSSLRSLELYISCYAVVYPYQPVEDQPSPEERPLSTLERGLAEWDPSSFAQRAFDASPKGTLKSIAISQAEHRTRGDFKLEYGAAADCDKSKLGSDWH